MSLKILKGTFKEIYMRLTFWNKVKFSLRMHKSVSKTRKCKLVRYNSQIIKKKLKYMEYFPITITIISI